MGTCRLLDTALWLRCPQHHLVTAGTCPIVGGSSATCLARGLAELCLFLLFSKEFACGNPLAVQWLRLRASSAGGVGSIPGWGTKIPPCHVLRPKK